MSGQVPPRCYHRDAPSTYSAKWDIAEPDSFHSGRNKLRTSYTPELTGRRSRSFPLASTRTRRSGCKRLLCGYQPGLVSVVGYSLVTVTSSIARSVVN